MYRKPFKTPFLKPPPKKTDEDGEARDTDSQDSRIYPPLSKKPKLGDHGRSASGSGSDSGNGATKGTIRLTSGSQATKRPFLTLQKTVKTKDTASTQADKIKSSGPGVELYFNVLWRKYTTKKHKTFDGDGILIISGGYATLQDLSGKDMGKSTWSKKIEPGDQISIGGKEVEIDSILSRADYLAGRPFLKNSTAAAALAIPTSTKAATTAPIIPSSQFKVPLLTASTIQTPKLSKNPTPRHDPTAENALVMPRPPQTFIPVGKKLVDVVVDPFICHHLRPHQREGVTFMYEAVMGLKCAGSYGAILADEMGLGKTLQTIALLWTLMKQNPIYDTGSMGGMGGRPVVKKALIVCPVTLINNWRKEFRKWLGNERIAVLAVGEKTNIRDFTVGKVYNVMIVGYERLQKIQGELKKADIDIVIADEGHRLKSEKNKAAQAIRSLKTQRRVILSGTPLQNDLHEFFIMIDFVNPGLLDTYANFRRTFEAPIVRSRQPEASVKDIEKGNARGDELALVTKMFVLRRTAEILSKYLPPKSEYVVFCRPTKLQLDVYRGILESPAFQSCLKSPQSSLQLITLLKKICNSPALLGKERKNSDSDDEKDLGSLLSNIKTSNLRHLTTAASGKLRVLENLIVTLRESTEEKIVLVSNYTSTLDLLQKLLISKGYTFLRLDGSTPAAKRQDLVDNFNKSDASTAFAFLLSAKSGGAGINLIGASRLVLYDLDWNPATDQQAMARIHRDGQRREVRIYRMITTGCIDEKIYQRQLSKQGLADSVMDQKASASSFTLAELRDLFTLDEETDCQTHDLLGCDCNGAGGGGHFIGVEGNINTDGASQPVSAEPSTEERSERKRKRKVQSGRDRNSNDSEGVYDSDDQSNTESPPNGQLPGLMKASEVDMVKIEEDYRNSKPNMRKAKKAQLSVLMGYEHYRDDAILRGCEDGASGGATTSPYFADSVEEEGGDEEEEKAAVATPVANVLGDEVLETVVRVMVKINSRSRGGRGGDEDAGEEGDGDGRELISAISFIFQKFE